jgi:molybdopterin synthase sulfur carrier subunit
LPKTGSALCNLPNPMAVMVKIPTQLRSVTGGDSETAVDGATTVGEVLDGLYERYDGLRDRIAEDGDLRRFVNVYVAGEDIRFLDGLDTAVEDGDEVTILPAVAGGS